MSDLYDNNTEREGKNNYNPIFMANNSPERKDEAINTSQQYATIVRGRFIDRTAKSIAIMLILKEKHWETRYVILFSR